MPCSPLTRALAVAGALGFAPCAIGAVQADTLATHHHRARPHHVQPRMGEQPAPVFTNQDGEQARRYLAYRGGDTSGYPGGNEFAPMAPFGGQAAVTAPPGTDAYKEQMNQRRYFCKWSSNRC